MSWGYSIASSNYFEVKDKAEFKKWAKKIGVEVIDGDGDQVAIRGEEGWPYIEDDDNDDDIDIAESLHVHLKDDSVAVLTEFYVDGSAGSGGGIAINAEGKRRFEGFPSAINKVAKALGRVNEDRPC